MIKANKMTALKWLVVIIIGCLSVSNGGGEYMIGVGSYDMSGPVAGVNLMGYANTDQICSGLHFRLRARTFIVASPQGPRFAFVNLDSGMASQLVTIKLLHRLNSRFGDLYTQENVAISGTHTHAGPGGYLQYYAYTQSSFGFVQQSFDVIVDAIELSIIRAHNSLKPGSVFLNSGKVKNAGINRSPSAYLMNPKKERDRYRSDVDTLMTLLKFVDNSTGKSVGGFSWFATHGTSMSRDNKLVSGDNKGAAARLFEDWFVSTTTTSQENSNSESSVSTLKEIASRLKATRGSICERNTSQAYKVRKNDRFSESFVGAFCQSNVGDVTPNVLGAVCNDTGKPCDFKLSSCNGNSQLCIGRGPGYPDEILSTKIIGERQFRKAVELFESTNLKRLTGKIDHRHTYLNFTDIKVDLGGKRVVRTCPAALGPGFAAGTTDGPGLSAFQQGDKNLSEIWILFRDGLKKPSSYQLKCQFPKPVLFDVGELFNPYAWAPAILPIQILRLGNLIILSVPGEFTTMAGRRLREAVKKTLISYGGGEFNHKTRIIIAGLTNTYSQYVTTFEEYKQQRYEASSTLYGPHTLSAYIQEFKKLAKAMARGETVPEGPSPPDHSSVLNHNTDGPRESLVPRGVRFGDVKDDVNLPKRGSFKRGERVTATFWSANPRHDLLIEGTFAVVETLRGRTWKPIHDDDDLSLIYRYRVDESGIYELANLEWEIPKGTKSGVYRLRHFGSSKKTKASPNVYFTGSSSAFAVY